MKNSLAFENKLSKDERRKHGAHYSSKAVVLKTIEPLFLNDLQKEFAIATTDKDLENLQIKISQLLFLDPACGTGNFLYVIHQELVALESKIKARINVAGKVSVSQLYGIEINEKAAGVCKEILLNSCSVNDYNSPYILVGNSLRIEWHSLLNDLKDFNKPPLFFNYITGNPPFIGKSKRTPEQTEDMAIVCKEMKDYKQLDYVAAFFIKAAQYMSLIDP